MTNTIQTFLNKALIVMLVASIVLTLILAREYHHAKQQTHASLLPPSRRRETKHGNWHRTRTINTPSISSRLLLTPRPYRPNR